MKKNLEIIWIILIILTVFAYLLGYLNYIDSALVGILLLTTFIKGALVIEHFMGLKDVELKYRIVPTVWLGFVLSAISFAYYF